MRKARFFRETPMDRLGQTPSMIPDKGYQAPDKFCGVASILFPYLVRDRKNRTKTLEDAVWCPVANGFACVIGLSNYIQMCYLNLCRKVAIQRRYFLELCFVPYLNLNFWIMLCNVVARGNFLLGDFPMMGREEEREKSCLLLSPMLCTSKG